MKKMLTIVIAGLVIYIGYEIIKKKNRENTKNEEERPENDTESSSSFNEGQLKIEEKRDFVNSSLFKELYDRFDLNTTDSSSFFSLLTKCRVLGGKVFLEKMSEHLKNNSTVEEINKTYQDLKEGKVRLDFIPQKEDDNSVKIFRSSIKKNLLEFDLENDAENDFQSMVIELLHKNFNAGKEQMVQDFEVYINGMNIFDSKGYKNEVEEVKKDMAQKIVKELSLL